jgi:serine/threonine-protein kinase
MAVRPIGGDVLVGQALGHYRVIEKIGSGGMGDVYRAHDAHLDREVAIKVLPPGLLADEHSRKRFHKEALALSKLNHPNIATIHDFDTQQGVDFLVMEYIAGESLSDKLLHGPLTEENAVALGSQLAAGLVAAHEHGIVHRDLKPGNLKLTEDGRLKILDFGLARLRGPLSEEAATESLTQTEGIAGTLLYMAPEQLLGQEVDSRTDIYAAGEVLYEITAGHRQFADVSKSQAIAAILHQTPRPPEAPHRAVSAPLQGVILKCLEKDPANRYQSARELERALQQLGVSSAAPSTPAPAAIRRSWGPLLATAAALLTVAGMFVGNFASLRDRVLHRAASPQIRCLAVLPLANLSGDASQDYFADGMTEALIANLSKIRALKVISRTSIMQYKAAKKPLPQIARELGADGILEGSVQRSGGRVLVTAQLIHAASDTHLWANTFERNVQDVLVLQSDVATTVASEIKVAITPEETRHLTRTRQVNPEAYEAYLKGRFHSFKLSQRDLNTGLQYFQLAAEKDPTYAQAYAGMAGAWFMLADAGFLPPDEAYPKAKTATLKALELDETLAEAHEWLADFAWLRDWDWATGEREFRRAIELDPNYADAHFAYSDFLITMKRPVEWSAEIHRAIELDQLNFFYKAFYGWHLIYAGRYDEAIAQFNAVLATEPDFSSAHMGLWGAYYKKGMLPEAFASARKFYSVLGDQEAVAALDRGYSAAGYRGAMKRAADTLASRSRHTHVPAIRIARLYAHASEKRQALRWLEEAYAQRETNLVHINVGWDWDALRSDPQFQDLLRRMRLPQS